MPKAHFGCHKLSPTSEQGSVPWSMPVKRKIFHCHFWQMLSCVVNAFDCWVSISYGIQSVLSWQCCDLVLYIKKWLDFTTSLTRFNSILNFQVVLWSRPGYWNILYCVFCDLSRDLQEYACSNFVLYHSDTSHFHFW